MKKTTLISVLFLLCSAFSLEAAEISLSVDEAVSLSLRDNREILLDEEDIKKAKAELAEAQAGLFPTLDFTGTWTQTRGYVSKDFTQNTTQVSLKQYLYQGAEVINTIIKNEQGILVSRAVLDKTRLEIALKVRKAFYSLLLSIELAYLNQGIAINSSQHLNSLKERYQKGEASASDILEGDACLENVRQQYLASLNQIDAMQTLLGNLLYLAKEVKIRPKAGFTFHPRELAYDEAFLKAMKNRPEISQYESQEKADKAALGIAKAGNRPDIYFSWDYYGRSHIAGTTIRNPNDYNVLGFTFSWPVFDGWATRAKVEQALADLEETRLLKEQTLKDIAKEVKDAYLALKDAIAKIKASEADIRLYADNLRAVQEKYKKGLSSLLDSSDAALKYAISLFNRKQAIYDYIVAKFNFDKATGGM